MTDVLGFAEIDRSVVGLVGGKAAHLGELSRIDGVEVPDGWCVTTAAYQRVVADAPGLDGRLDELGRLDAADRAGIAALSAELRAAVAALPVPDDLAAAVTRPVVDGAAYAVRSSATTEDLPTASAAGQQDTYLNVVGAAAVLDRVRACWASLFTERAVTYRRHNGIDERGVRMAVVVQEMVAADASGVMFTADPVTSNRTVTGIEAVFGLGEALVSGLVDADTYSVRDGAVDVVVAAKRSAVRPLSGGGTEMCPLDVADRERSVLSDVEALRLAATGRAIESRFGGPQDIEWCRVDGGFRIVQSRPITTLFPVPEATDDADDTVHVYISVGHQQMMTDAMTPPGLSFWQMTTPRPMAEAGGRLFVDVTPILAAPASRDGFLDMAGRADPLMRDALETVVERGIVAPAASGDAGARSFAAAEPIAPDPDLVAELIAATRASLTTVREEIGRHDGSDLLDFVRTDLEELRRLLFDRRSHQVFTTAMDAAWWLGEHLGEWLGEPEAADTLTQSVPDNVTSEMGLALLDVADAIRPHPEVVAFLRTVSDDGFLDELGSVAGGPEARDALCAFLDAYGMRCVGEIDITRPRWAECPSTLLPLILADVDTVEPGAGRRLFEAGRRAAAEKERDVLTRLRALPDGEQKAAETTLAIDRLRTFIGFREYPKFGMISRYAVYKQAIMGEADRLVGDGVLADREDVFFLRFDELVDVVRTGVVDHDLVLRRREAFRGHRALTPPRVLTSDGEVFSGSYRRDDVPPGALVGLAVSTGVVEGRARTVLDVTAADLEPGDILVTAHTDPSWSPVFVTAAALVTEVGGRMTHGAVVAREYGLPAVVGVDSATRLIRDGQRIRVDGTSGFVELLP